MKTFGRLDTQELVSVVLDDEGNPRIETLTPNPVPENWTPPVLVPLVKQPKPEHTSAQVCEPALAWFGDRVERGWSVRDKTAEELAAEARKTWKTVQDFVQNIVAVAPTALAQVELSSDPNIAGLRAMLYSWRSDVWSDHPLILQGFQVLQGAGILSAQQVALICAK